MRLTEALSRAYRRWNPISVKYSNLPDRYIKRAMEQVYWRTPKGPQYQRKVVERTRFKFKTDRPWTTDFRIDNAPGTPTPVIHVEPILHWSFFRGDRVELLIGRDKGKQGFVKQIIAERNWVLVEGLNTRLETVGKKDDFPGIVVVKELPLLVTTDIKLVDPSDLQPTDIVWRYTEDGQHVRVSTRTGRIIPKPMGDLETIDYKVPHLYKERPKDTLKADVEEITFKPELKTFEMDIMDKMGIKEDRVPKKYWWY